MPPDPGKLDAALRENMKKRKAQQQARQNLPPPQEPLEPERKPA